MHSLTHTLSHTTPTTCVQNFPSNCQCVLKSDTRYTLYAIKMHKHVRTRPPFIRQVSAGWQTYSMRFVIERKYVDKTENRHDISCTWWINLQQQQQQMIKYYPVKSEVDRKFYKSTNFNSLTKCYMIDSGYHSASCEKQKQIKQFNTIILVISI